MTEKEIQQAMVNKAYQHFVVDGKPTAQKNDVGRYRDEMVIRVLPGCF